jgi:hypothetical protein
MPRSAATRVSAEALICVEFEVYTVTTTPKAVKTPSGAVRAVCQVQGQAIRYRSDLGGAPTGAVGLEATPGTLITLEGPADLANFQFVRHADAETGGKLACQFYG